MEKKKTYVWDNDLSRFNEKYAWNLFRLVRWKSKWKENPPCIYCEGKVWKTSTRKEGNQFFYQCQKCDRRFTDLTGTPFHKTRLPIRSILFLIILSGSSTPNSKIARLIKIARTTVVRYTLNLKESNFCQELKSELAKKGITKKTLLVFYSKKDPACHSDRREEPSHKKRLTRDDYPGQSTCRRYMPSREARRLRNLQR